MSIAGRRKRNRIDGQFAPRTIEMLRSYPYRILSQSAHRLLARIEIEFADHGGTDNGKLPITYADFVEYGLDRHAIGPAINECEALGFIEVTERGRSGNAEFRKPNLFRLTYRYTELAGPTDEWHRIETKKDALAIALAARKSSIGRNRRKRKQRQGEPLRAVG